MLSQNCVGMLVYGLQRAGPSSPGTAPTSLFVPSSIWNSTPPSSSCGSSKNTPSLHPPQIPPMSFPSCTPSLAWFGPQCWCKCVRTHPPRFPGNNPDIHANPCFELCQLTAAWLSFCYPWWSGHRCTLSELNYYLVTFLPLPVFCYWLRIQKNHIIISTSPDWYLCSSSFLIIYSLLLYKYSLCTKSLHFLILAACGNVNFFCSCMRTTAALKMPNVLKGNDMIQLGA